MIEALFPNVLFYLIFVDTLGWGVDLYHLKSHGDVHEDTSRQIMHFIDPAMVLADIFLLIVYFAVGGYGFDVSGEMWDALCQSFPSSTEDIKRLHHFVSKNDNTACLFIFSKDSNSLRLLKFLIQPHCKIFIREQYQYIDQQKFDSLLVIAATERKKPSVFQQDGIAKKEEIELIDSFPNKLVVVIAESTRDLEADLEKYEGDIFILTC